MVMLPSTVKELKDYLETYPDDMEVYMEDDDGQLFGFSIDDYQIPLYRGDEERVLIISALKVLDIKNIMNKLT